MLLLLVQFNKLNATIVSPLRQVLAAQAMLHAARLPRRASSNDSRCRQWLRTTLTRKYVRTNARSNLRLSANVTERWRSKTVEIWRLIMLLFQRLGPLSLSRRLVDSAEVRPLIGITLRELPHLPHVPHLNPKQHRPSEPNDKLHLHPPPAMVPALPWPLSRVPPLFLNRMEDPAHLPVLSKALSVSKSLVTKMVLMVFRLLLPVLPPMVKLTRLLLVFQHQLTKSNLSMLQTSNPRATMAFNKMMLLRPLRLR
jgi:hypothetical protein